VLTNNNLWLNVIFRPVLTRTPIAPQPRQPIHYHHVGVALVGGQVGARHGEGHPRAIERELGVGHDAQPGQVADLKGPRSGLRPQGREGQRQGGQWFKRCFHNPKLGKMTASDGISRCAKPRPARGLPCIRRNAPISAGPGHARGRQWAQRLARQRVSPQRSPSRPDKYGA